MTTEKAIEQLGELIKEAKSHMTGNKSDDKILIDDKTALEMAIQALEKQVPKKVIKRCSTDKLFVSHKYPVCKKMPMYRGYCYNCGQALDWSDENE